ncbi:Bacterial Ig-like domain (group 2) [Stieleria neptunia]|uniref:Bacterial Ig-like domain (Group 2) n=1 Tax=Stieleria neptunia TaxID=2527979 RepID=A0A518HWH6_9BACT|nr:DUF1549 and DUF1553 domain-containing protein [Stieleria neptunia]QDV45209.1 Bacterial Ig-like domain (group 2) [Stieleria neptunia]
MRPRLKSFRSLLLVVVIAFLGDCIVSAAAPAGEADFAVLPPTIELQGRESRQRISIVGLRDQMPSAVLDRESYSITIEDPTIATIQDGVVTAVADGQTTLRCRVGARVIDVPVVVSGTETTHRWSFRHDVQSVLAKAGCNMGSCHGALAGKGGFRLSLRGYDSQSDFLSITRQARGRRIEMADPGRSLLLAKPTGALPHKGGLRLEVDSHDYRVISRWIADGAEGPRDDDPTLERISVMPENALLSPGDTSQVLVSAHYDDGRVIDVTHWAKFTATDEAVAGVDGDGLARVRGSGEAAVLVWFGSKVVLARMTVPYEHSVAAESYQDAPRRNFIDQENLTQLRTLNLLPSPRCSDETFLRRSTLDTIGRLPTPEERQQFLASDPRDRRDDWIERLLSSDDFVSYWAYKWSDMLLINGTRLRPIAVKTYYAWVRDRVRQNQPWDEFVREILTATGRSDENGATNFYALHQSPEDMTENACQAFLGLSIGCAKCHNHPLEKWTNEQYYAMANLFARVRAKGWGGDGRNGDGLRTLYVSTSGELIQPNRGHPQPPAPLDAPPIAFDNPDDRRQVLATWMTDPDNPYFARSISNRVWANFFGRGLVEQVDDLRLSNPASNESLLTALSDHVVDVDFDLKQLMRTILQSETYQRSSVALPENGSEGKYHSRYYPKRLMAEVMLDSIDQVLGTSTTFNEVAFPGADRQKTDFYETGTRAIELFDASVNSYFLKTFGRNPREITCECERSDEPSMVQVLHLSNGDTLNPKLTAKRNVITEAVEQGLDDEAILRALFLRGLSREPLESERDALLGVLSEYGREDRLTGLQDVAWSVLTSTEFTFNH